MKYPAGGERSAPDQAHYQLLLAAGLKLLTGESDVRQAIGKSIPRGVVGLKTNCLSPRLTHTPIALTDALAELLVAAGFAENDIVVWERTNRELKRAGYRLNASSFGRRCLGTDTNQIGYSSQHYNFEDVNSRVSRILTQMVDSNINLPVLKDHSIAGLSGGLKNMFGAIHNPNKYHDYNCNPFAAQVNNLKPIRMKNRLTIMDAFRVQYHGGPGLKEEYINYYGGLIIAADPVAADRVGLEILEHLRQRNNLPSLAKTGRPVNYLKSAEQTGLGVADLKKIDLVMRMVEKDGKQQEGKLF